jgi:glutamyl-tRNA reductase
MSDTDELFTRAEKAAMKRQMKATVKEYVKEFLDAEARKQARAIVKELKAEIKALTEKEFKRRLPKAIKASLGKIQSQVTFYTSSKRRYLGREVTDEHHI